MPLAAGGPFQINTSILWNMSVYGGRVLWVSLNDTHKRCQAMITVGNDSMEYYLIMALSVILIEVQIINLEKHSLHFLFVLMVRPFEAISW